MQQVGRGAALWRGDWRAEGQVPVSGSDLLQAMSQRSGRGAAMPQKRAIDHTIVSTGAKERIGTSVEAQRGQ